MKKLVYILPILLLSCGPSEEQATDAIVNENADSISGIEIPEADSKTTYTDNVDNVTFKQLLTEKNGLLIDVRTPDEYAQGHIENAINIDFRNENFESIIDTIDRSTSTFLYCKSGGRSSDARDLLISKQFSEVYNLTNGYSNWEE
jgi:rhodanese-related sulfurtransferase